MDETANFFLFFILIFLFSHIKNVHFKKKYYKKDESQTLPAF